MPGSRKIYYKNLLQRKFVRKMQAKPNLGTLGLQGNEKKHFSIAQYS